MSIGICFGRKDHEFHASFFFVFRISSQSLLLQRMPWTYADDVSPFWLKPLKCVGLRIEASERLIRLLHIMFQAEIEITTFIELIFIRFFSVNSPRTFANQLCLFSFIHRFAVNNVRWFILKSAQLSLHSFKHSLFLAYVFNVHVWRLREQAMQNESKLIAYVLLLLRIHNANFSWAILEI